MDQIEETIKNSRSMKTKRLGIGRHRLFALKGANSNVTLIMKEVVRVTEKFYTLLWSAELIFTVWKSTTFLATQCCFAKA